MFEKEEASAILNRKEEITSEDFICPKTKQYVSISYCNSFLDIELEHSDKKSGCKYCSTCKSYLEKKEKENV